MYKLLFLLAVFPVFSSANEVPSICLPPTESDVYGYVLPEVGVNKQLGNSMVAAAECVREKNNTLECLHEYRVAKQFCGASNVAKFTEAYVEYAEKILVNSSDAQSYKSLIEQVK
jgi:hypothetical protein